MPPRYGRIANLPEGLEQADLLEALNAMIDEVNVVLNEVGVAESVSRGDDGFMPFHNSTLDMKDNRIINTLRSRQPTDVVTRIELEEIGLFTNDGQVSFNAEVNFSQGATVSGGGGGSTSITTVQQVLETTGSATEGLVATNTDGDRISIRDDNVNGNAQGTLAMFRDSNGRAALGQVHEGAQITTDRAVLAMLELIYTELRRLNGVPDNGLAK